MVRRFHALKNFITRHPKHIPPLSLLVVLILLTILKISGTSIGTYHTQFYGEVSRDPNLVYGHPRLIRSDEFLVITQMTIMQSENGFSQINPVQGEGKDVSVVLDVPYKEWSAIFKPQNFSFFVLPLEHAFAFKWWAMLFALLIAAYYFFLRILGDNKILLSIMGAVLVGFSPFVFWWYQAGTILPIVYGFIMLLIGMSLIDEIRPKQKKTSGMTLRTLAKCLAMSYALICFILVLYPPFQVPIALIVLFTLVGYALQKLERAIVKPRVILRLVLPFVVVVFLATSVCAVFVATRYDTFKAITETAYPGKREIQSGQDYSLKRLLVSYLQPQLQRESRGTQYHLNQSESSMFIVSSLIVLIPSIAALVWLYRKSRKIEWILLSLTALNALFLAHIFLPLPSFITKLFLLHLVPQQRLLIGIGLAGTITLIYMTTLLRKKLVDDRAVKYFAYGYILLLFAAGLWAGLGVMKTYPGFVSNIYLVVLLNAIVCSGILLFLRGKAMWGLGVLALFSILSVVYIHPLYRGLGELASANKITTAIREVSPKDSVWGSVDGTYINNFPQIAGRNSISGVEFYPNKAFWEKYIGKENEQYYNRYAHVVLSDSPETIRLIQPDLFELSVHCDKPIAQKIDFLLSTKPLSLECVSLVRQIDYPAAKYYIYKLQHQ